MSTRTLARSNLLVDEPRAPHQRRSGLDKVFRVVVVAGALVFLGASLYLVWFLGNRGWSAFRADGAHILASDRWAPQAPRPSFGILGDLVGSAIIAVIALVVALPVGLSTALMINEYAPAVLRRSLITLVDLLATVPGIIFGLWGLTELNSHSDSTARWLSHWASSIPIFRDPDVTYGNSLMVCGIVVGIMVLPIITSISREVMAQAPRDVCEAALALGGTRWGTISDVILPFARNGIIGAVLLAFGRAIGETIAVVLILSRTDLLTHDLLGPVGGSIAALIASDFEGASPGADNAMTFAGLLLLASTFIASLLARAILSGKLGLWSKGGARLLRRADHGVVPGGAP
jgi:phosphate transport system permease protein